MSSNQVQSEPIWIASIPELGSLDSVVFQTPNINYLRIISRSFVEKTGFLYGVIRDKSLYFMGVTTLGVGDRTSSSFNSQYSHFHNALMKRLMAEEPNIATLVYHNQPNLKPDEVDPQTLLQIREAIRTGTLNRVFGKTPTLDEAVPALLSHRLSPADRVQLAGQYTVLVTDTSGEDSDFQHLRAYAVPENTGDNVRKMQVVSLSSVSQDDRAWAHTVCKRLERTYAQLAASFEK